MINSRFIGGILLIVGTSIGAGMLALPVANAAAGFWSSTLFLFLCWAAMTAGAFYILEANLYLPPGKHMVSMASETLGKKGLLIAWLSYLLLMYSLLSAYISGGADVMQALLAKAHVDIPVWLASVLFVFIFGLIAYSGIKSVDYTNRMLMFGKLGVFLLLLVLITPNVKLNNLTYGEFHYVGGSLMILITSFGFAIIVPNLRDYFNDDIKALRKLIFYGSLIPLFCYIAWDAVIIGTLPYKGESSLQTLMNDPQTVSSLAAMLSNEVNSGIISAFFNFFISVCMLTAFLGVSLCMISFLADGLKVRQEGKEGLGLFILTFVPPLIVVIFYPGAYLYALSYAGVFCVILLLLLPALMCWHGRRKFSPEYMVPGGKVLQVIVIAVSILLLVYRLLGDWYSF